MFSNPTKKDLICRTPKVAKESLTYLEQLTQCYKNATLMGELAIQVIALAAKDETLVQRLSCSPQLHLNPVFLKMAQVEKDFVTHLYAVKHVPGNSAMEGACQAMERVVKNCWCSSLAFQTELTDYFCHWIISYDNWEQYERHTVTMLFFMVSRIVQQLKGVSMPKCKKEELYSALSTAIFETCQSQSCELEQYWFKKDKVCKRLLGANKRYRQRLVNLQVERAALKRHTDPGNDSGCIQMSDVYKVAFEDVTRMLMVQLICYTDQNECDLFHRLRKAPDFHKDVHYKELIKLIITKVERQKRENNIRWARCYLEDVKNISCYYGHSGVFYQQHLEEFIKETLLKKHLCKDKWETIIAMFFLMTMCATSLYEEGEQWSDLRDKKIQGYEAIADACYWAIAETERPTELDSYFYLE